MTAASTATRVSALLTDEQSHPLTLFRVLTENYRHEWMEWPPSVLRTTLLKDFGVSVSRVNLNKALAVAAIATRNEFWTSWETFHFLCQALNNNIPDPGLLQEHTVGQMMAAVDIASQLRKELKDLAGETPEFSEEVARYVAAQALHQGVWYLPPPLDFSARYAAKKWYRCKDCGQEGEVLFDDGICDVCVERFDTSSLGGWEPNPHLWKRGLGKNIEIFEKNPTDKVKDRLEKALHSNVILKESSEDVCAARLLIALQYMSFRQNQFKEQS